MKGAELLLLVLLLSRSRRAVSPETEYLPVVPLPPNPLAKPER